MTLILHPENFKTVDDTGDFLWLRQHLTSGIAKTGSNNILVYSVPIKDETKIAENIIAVRNSIGKKYIPGTDPETMHMITEEAYRPYTSQQEIWDSLRVPPPFKSKKNYIFFFDDSISTLT